MKKYYIIKNLKTYYQKTLVKFAIIIIFYQLLEKFINGFYNKLKNVSYNLDKIVYIY